jgi:hypothetical protein
MFSTGLHATFIAYYRVYFPVVVAHTMFISRLSNKKQGLCSQIRSRAYALKGWCSPEEKKTVPNLDDN